VDADSNYPARSWEMKYRQTHQS